MALNVLVVSGVMSAVDSNEARCVRGLGGRSKSARPADYQQACSWHGWSTYLHFAISLNDDDDDDDGLNNESDLYLH